MKKVFAVFIVATKGSLFAATTRCKDKGENPCSVAFPGGKVDKGESLHESACREAKEEGFSFQKVEAKPFYTTTVEGKMVPLRFKPDTNSKLSLGMSKKGISDPVVAPG